MNPAIILSHGSGVNGLAITRSLGRLGVRTYVIAEEKTVNLAAVSRYCAKSVWIREERADCLVEAVKQIVRDIECTPVLFCDSDEALHLASTCAEVLNKMCIVPYPLMRFSELNDKEYQAERAMAAGIDVPRTWYVDTWEDISAIDKAGYEGRLLVKPNPQRYAKSAPFKVMWGDTPEALVKQLKPLVDMPEGMIVQEFIDGDDACMWVVSGYRGMENKCTVLLPMIKTKQSGSGAGGVGIIVHTQSNAELASKAVRFVSETAYHGPFAMEFKYCEAKRKYYFIENNFRTARIHVIGRRVGADLPKIIYADVTGQQLCRDDKRATTRVMWYYDIAGCCRTIPHTRDRRVLWSMVRNMIAAPVRRKEWAVHAWDDVTPTVVSAWALWKEMGGRALRRMHRMLRGTRVTTQK